MRCLTVHRRVVAVLAGLIAGVTLGPAPALAHGGLAVSVPAHGSTVTSPADAVTLTFTEAPAPYAYFTITGPGGARVDRGWSTAQPVRLATPVREFQEVNGSWQPMLYNTGFSVRVKVAHWPATGPYVVRYHTVASDGDQVKGEIGFTYTGAVTPAPPGWQPPTDPPKAELAATGPSTPAQAQPAQARPAKDSRVWVWVVPVLLVIAAGLGYLLLRRPRRR